jgi:hypothetical protein
MKENQYGGLSNEIEKFLNEFVHFKIEIGHVIQTLYCIKNNFEQVIK